MNASDKELMRKNKKKHPKRRQKAITVSVIYSDSSNILVSNYINNNIDKEHVRFNPRWGIWKSLIKEKMNRGWIGNIQQKKLLEDKDK